VLLEGAAAAHVCSELPMQAVMVGGKKNADAGESSEYEASVESKLDEGGNGDGFGVQAGIRGRGRGRGTQRFKGLVGALAAFGLSRHLNKAGVSFQEGVFMDGQVGLARDSQRDSIVGRRRARDEEETAADAGRALARAQVDEEEGTAAAQAATGTGGDRSVIRRIFKEILAPAPSSEAAALAQSE